MSFFEWFIDAIERAIHSAEDMIDLHFIESDMKEITLTEEEKTLHDLYDSMSEMDNDNG